MEHPLAIGELQLRHPGVTPESLPNNYELITIIIDDSYVFDDNLFVSDVTPISKEDIGWVIRTEVRELTEEEKLAKQKIKKSSILTQPSQEELNVISGSIPNVIA